MSFRQNIWVVDSFDCWLVIPGFHPFNLDQFRGEGFSSVKSGLELDSTAGLKPATELPWASP